MACAAATALTTAAAAGQPERLPPPSEDVGDAPPAEGYVTFEADTLTFDEQQDIITASGNVLLVRGAERLTADTVTWNRRTDRVAAEGQVLVVDGNGNRAVADRVELSGDLKDGAIENLLVVLQDGARLAARSGVRADNRTTMERAVYSPCDVVDRDSGCPQTPLWSLKAVRVVHDPVRGRVFYRNARLEFFGVPVVALPSLSHPDGVDRSQTGLLAPQLRLSRELGGEIGIPWFWSIAPDRDLTLTGYAFTNAPPMLGAQYRQLFLGGPIDLAVRATYAESERIDLDSGQIVRSPARFRGYFDGRGQIAHGNGWRSSFSVRLTNDDNFLGRYQISLDTRLRSSWTLERFSDRRYLSIAGWAFQGLNPDDRAARTPVALPLLDYWWRPEGDALGGSLLVRANTLALFRREGQSIARALASAQWDRQLLTVPGQRIMLTALIRGDIYNTRNSDLADEPIYAGREGWSARIIPLAAVDIDWPFFGPLFGGTQTLSPRVQLVASTASANRNTPNEDSRAIDLEDSNLFALNRFPGQDRWEGGARITYGLDWRWRRRGIQASAQLGQSYRLDDQSDVFPDGTGLSERVSDVVGRLQLRIGRNVQVTQRVRLDKDNLAVRRNETDVALGSRQTFVSVGYLKFNRNITLGDLVDHEEVRAGARVAFGRYWSAFGSAVIDLTSRAEDPFTSNDGWQPIRHRLGLRYSDECFDFGLSWKRNYVDNPNARRGNTFLFTLALRNLG